MPTIVSGSIALLQAVLGWLLALVPVGAGVMVAYHAVAKQMSAGDEMAVHAHNRAIRNTIVSAVLAESAASLVQLVLSYYR